MTRSQSPAPAALPLLSRGRHRRGGRRGGCFMEYASVLSGERWSDHPRCTHPLLASLARAVNDSTSDRERPRLAPLIPSVIGVNSADPRLDGIIALHCARTALDAATPETAGLLAMAVLACERHLAVLERRPSDDVSPASRATLQRCPAATAWARQYLEASAPVNPRDFRCTTGAASVRQAVVALRSTPDPDTSLRTLLETAIGVCWDAVQRTGDARPLARVPVG